MSTLFFLFILREINLFSYKNGQLWSTCSRCKICTLQNYWYVASTVSYILINFTGNRKSHFFSSFIFWNKHFTKWASISRGKVHSTPCEWGQEMFWSITSRFQFVTIVLASKSPFLFFKATGEQAGVTRQDTCWGLHSPMLRLTTWQ